MALGAAEPSMGKNKAGPLVTAIRLVNRTDTTPSGSDSRDTKAQRKV